MTAAASTAPAQVLVHDAPLLAAILGAHLATLIAQAPEIPVELLRGDETLGYRIERDLSRLPRRIEVRVAGGALLPLVTLDALLPQAVEAEEASGDGAHVDAAGRLWPTRIDRARVTATRDGLRPDGDDLIATYEVTA